MITQPMSKKLRKWERKTRKEAANCKANKGRTLLDLASTRPRSNRIIVNSDLATCVAIGTNADRSKYSRWSSLFGGFICSGVADGIIQKR